MMRGLRRLITIALAATALLAAIAAAAASAREFESSTQNTRIVFRPVKFLSSTGDTVSCTVTRRLISLQDHKEG